MYKSFILYSLLVISLMICAKSMINRSCSIAGFDELGFHVLEMSVGFFPRVMQVQIYTS